MTDNILWMPYAVVPRQWIDRLIQTGVLQASRRHDARAVENALLVLRQRSRKILDIDEEPSPAK
jgi:hypothetical protein